MVGRIVAENFTEKVNRKEGTPPPLRELFCDWGFWSLLFGGVSNFDVDGTMDKKKTIHLAMQFMFKVGNLKKIGILQTLLDSFVRKKWPPAFDYKTIFFSLGEGT